MRDPQARAAAAASVPDLQAMNQPMTRKDMVDILEPLIAVYGDTKTTDEWRVAWREFYETIGHLPALALLAAKQAYKAQPNAFTFPKPGPLLALAEEKRAELARNLRWAKIIATIDPMATLDEIQAAYAASFDQGD
ncbi:hypothetical protein CPT_Sansa85 [Caulobacter phage Sansa]|uniref:Uncharacterized protein n=1 Tax=Caulobacter phage Sansa TaxID=1675600 RepID=A0A0K1LM08_9CAUD|nr:hypothetical protein HOR07_gp085 [Caulobacter phage Sansa]AKU43489.1 hypothetical protein CPT_Sansa85 [Caulobacter phage Sansa]